LNGNDELTEPFETATYIKTAEAEGPVYHPTQKPIELGRYLIKTYTNPGDIVLDNASGSGSFLIAALLEGRNFIGIEKNQNSLLHKIHTTDYIKITIERIEKTLKEMNLGKMVNNNFKMPLVANHTVNYVTEKG
jgi:DNA modification methylase